MNNGEKWDLFYTRKDREPFIELSNEQINDIFSNAGHIKHALDIGCGEGQLMNDLEKRGVTVVGIDPSSVAIDNASKITKGKLINNTFENAALNNLVFDLVVIKFVIAFISNYDKFFIKLLDHVHNNTVVVILTPVLKGKTGGVKENEIFASQELLEKSLFKYFNKIEETVLHVEGKKKLSQYICYRKLKEEGL